VKLHCNQLTIVNGIPVDNAVMKVNVVFTVATLRIRLWLGLVLTVAVSGLRSGDSKADVYRREYPRIMTSVIKNGNSADKLCHPISVALSEELVLLNKQQISGGGACLHCYQKNFHGK